ncbi:hypothetical protein [Nonomuraea zeae]|uniref:Uncharacterized protein n=1 Tax=Nonomuraea zeae TaxID=1642303 RepID=A0A5S4GQQ1_9ACTN|nr:hypothetical protein [Nonomuraea zeae]TMR35197.1 hypothetical protein ETD85_14465 [Nonomuraea zeae]
MSVPSSRPEKHAADALADALAAHGVSTNVHDGYGLSLVSVWIGLVVWCDGEWYWWRTGWDDRRKRVLYARHPAIEPSRAARRIAFRYADLRSQHPWSGTIHGLPFPQPMEAGPR